MGSAASDGTRHDEFARALKRAGYAGWTSIEMVPAPENPLEGIETALTEAARRYR